MKKVSRMEAMRICAERTGESVMSVIKSAGENPAWFRKWMKANGLSTYLKPTSRMPGRRKNGK